MKVAFGFALLSPMILATAFVAATVMTAVSTSAQAADESVAPIAPLNAPAAAPAAPPMAVVPAPAPAPQKAPPPPPPANPPNDVDYVHVDHKYVPDRHTWHFGGYLGGDLGGNMNFSNGTFTSGGETIDTASLTYRADPAATLGLEAVWRASHAWGVSLGLSVDTPRTISDPKFSSIGGSAFTETNDATLHVETFMVSAQYQWDHWYIPFGLNISAAHLQNEPLAVSGLKGSVGGQIGFGYLFDEHFALEALARGIGLNTGGTVSDGSSSLDMKGGEMEDLQINVKGYF